MESGELTSLVNGDYWTASTFWSSVDVISLGKTLLISIVASCGGPQIKVSFKNFLSPNDYLLILDFSKVQN